MTNSSGQSLGLTFDGFNELDSFIALGLLNRLSGWKAEITSPTTHVTSMNGVTVQAQQSLAFANEAEAVIFGSGIYTRALAQNSAMLDRLQLDPLRHMIGSQCSGALLLARLGLLADMPACTDLTRGEVKQAAAQVFGDGIEDVLLLVVCPFGTVPGHGVLKQYIESLLKLLLQVGDRTQSVVLVRPHSKAVAEGLDARPMLFFHACFTGRPRRARHPL